MTGPPRLCSALCQGPGLAGPDRTGSAGAGSRYVALVSPAAGLISGQMALLQRGSTDSSGIPPSPVKAAVH